MHLISETFTNQCKQGSPKTSWSWFGAKLGLMFQAYPEKDGIQINSAVYIYLKIDVWSEFRAKDIVAASSSLHLF